MARKKLVIIDAYSLLFRAFYGTRFLSTSNGQPTNALFGFVSMLFVLLEREKPDSIVVAFDAPGKTFRHHEFAEYKAKRAETPQELISQFPLARDLIESLGIPSIEVTGYEADDVIGTISLDAEANDYDTTIVSGDLDQLQLVDDHVKVMTTRKGVTDVVYYDPEAVEERYGFGPKYVTDFKALAGDPSDNIPGVPGVGAKTASALIQQFGSVEEIIKNIEKVEPKFRKKLEPHLDKLRQYKRLVTIVRDAPIEFDYKPLTITSEQMQDAVKMLQSLEFRMHMKRLPAILKPYMKEAQEALPELIVESERPRVNTESLQGDSDLRKWLDGREAGVFFADNRAFLAVGLEARETPAGAADAAISDAPGRFVLHDAKPVIKRLAIDSPVAFDTLLAAYVLQPGRARYDLDDLAQGYLDEPPPSAPAEFASALSRLVRPMRERLQQEEQWTVFSEIELPLTPILAGMEEAGILLDSDMLREYGKGLADTIAKVRSTIYELAGEEFNIGSTQQLRKILFEKLNLPAARKTKTGYSTGADVLIQLAPQHEIVQEILTWRELTKLKSTYVNALPKLVAEDDRIHTTFQQTVAATGRLSSSDPNMQNIPIRTEMGREVRRAFIAPKEFSLASLDYSQIELRILAHLCKDETLVDAFQHRRDVHSVTASLMWDEKIEDVSKEHRRYAKMLNYAVLYGVTDFGLANQLGGEFTVAEAKGLIGDYFKRFPAVQAYTDSILAEARAKGFTKTLMGRRRYFPDIHAANRARRLYSERQAMNAPLQGSAADMIKLAMIKIWPMLSKKKTRLLLQVHDELLFELADSEQDLVPKLRDAMAGAMPLDVPTDVDVSVGANWLEMKDVPS